jgi:hypothetical protein
MDLSRYRELLGRFHDVVLACGGPTAKVSSKWVAEFDRSMAGTSSHHLLMLHLAQVRRSAEAIAILARTSIPNESVPLSEGLTESAAYELLSEVKRIQETIQRTRRVLKDQGVQALVDKVLSSVAFVMDYAQFDFNGSSLTTFIWPEWSRGSDTLRESDPGYRDALCGLIGQSVSNVAEGAERLVLRFTSGELLSISLQAEECRGPESANFVSETGGFWVW